MDYKSLPDELRKGTARAINRSAKTALNAVVKNITHNYNITSGNVKKLLRIVNATKNKLTAILKFRQKSLGLINFGARQTLRGVTVKVKKSGGRQLRRSSDNQRGTFIATMRSGHRGVFIRTGNKRLPIRELFGPSAADIFKSHKSIEIARKQFYIAFEKNIQSELNYRLKVK